MPLTLQDVAFGIGGTPAAPLGGVCGKLSNRQDLIQRGVYQWIQQALLELSRNYRFSQLERTGPIFTLTPGVTNYPINNFINTVDQGKVVNLIPSLFRYFNFPLNQIPQGNAGSTLKWKTIDALELMLNTPGVPTFWTRFQDAVWLAPVTLTPLQVFMRYQIEYQFAALAAAPTDAFVLPNDWLDIVEYCAAQRGAIDLRLLDYASQYHTIVFGDPEFQRSSGGRGNPGLIFRRFTQMETDAESMMKSIRVNVVRC
jgi:hypothetical protein